MAMTNTVTDETFEQEVLAAGGPVLLDFWATWCPPCRMLAPILEELRGELAGRLAIKQIDADTNPNTVTRCGVSAMPTLILFVDGRPIERWIGFQPRARLMARLAPHLDLALQPS